MIVHKDMMNSCAKSALIITGGDLDCNWAMGFVSGHSYDFVIAVDAGLQYAAELGMVPNLAVGDFDTLGCDRLQGFRDAFDGAVDFEVHKPEKDETDTELALLKAFEHGCVRADIIGALGGRIDHELSNLQLLLMAEETGIDAAIYDGRNKIRLAHSGDIYRKSEAYGEYISFVPLTYEVKHISLKGFKYPLAEHDVRMGRSLLISNEIVEDEALITFEEGRLLTIESKD